MNRRWTFSLFVGRATAVLAVCSVLCVGQFGKAAAEPPELSTDGQVELAWSWVRSMLATATRVESASTITPQLPYPADWTGPVSGTFVVRGVQPPPVISAAVELDPPSAAAAGAEEFRGLLTGRITLPPQQNRWIIQAYRHQNGQRMQVPVQSLVRPDGTFEIDLAATDPGPGSWQFGVLDALAGYAPAGLPWPSPGTYSGWEIRSFATTDRRYPTGAQPAAADGTFRFPSSAPGVKTFQLVAVGDNADGDRVLAEFAPATGLVRSYSDRAGSGVDGGAGSANSHSYDQALALQTALVMDDLPTARVLLHGLLTLQSSTGPQSGGFISTAPQVNPAAGEPLYRTGNTAIALYSMLSYLQRTEQSDPDASAIRRAAGAAADWLIRQQSTTGTTRGLLTGGWGEAGPAGATDPAVRLLFASTEHNLDAWHALSRAGQVLACQRCTTAADALQQSILGILWDRERGGLTQGMRPAGRDTVDPLDVNSWGSIFLDAIGRSEWAETSIRRTAAFAVSDKSIEGFLAFHAQPAIPHPVPSVWFEGSFGVALARARHGDAAGHRSIVDRLRTGQRPDGSFPAASRADVDRELTTASAVAATTWFILAARADHPGSLWSRS